MIVCVCVICCTQPEKALVVYEQALKKNPRDSVLTSKVGQALVKTHHYTKVQQSNTFFHLQSVSCVCVCVSIGY